MRCGCQNCSTYMTHSESLHLGCVCPQCGRRCTDCLGTNTVISREKFQQLRENPVAFEGYFEFEGRLEPLSEQTEEDRFSPQD